MAAHRIGVKQHCVHARLLSESPNRPALHTLLLLRRQPSWCPTRRRPGCRWHWGWLLHGRHCRLLGWLAGHGHHGPRRAPRPSHAPRVHRLRRAIPRAARLHGLPAKWRLLGRHVARLLEGAPRLLHGWRALHVWLLRLHAGLWLHGWRALHAHGRRPLHAHGWALHGRPPLHVRRLHAMRRRHAHVGRRATHGSGAWLRMWRRLMPRHQVGRCHTLGRHIAQRVGHHAQDDLGVGGAGRMCVRVINGEQQWLEVCFNLRAARNAPGLHLPVQQPALSCQHCEHAATPRPARHAVPAWPPRPSPGGPPSRPARRPLLPPPPSGTVPW